MLKVYHRIHYVTQLMFVHYAFIRNWVTAENIHVHNMDVLWEEIISFFYNIILLFISDKMISTIVATVSERHAPPSHANTQLTQRQMRRS